MLKGQLLFGDELKRAYEGKAGKLLDTLTDKIQRLTYTLLRIVKADKLTGQVLNVRSGRLRRSINAKMMGQGTAKVEGKVGTNVVYARSHEYGNHETVTVKEHLRMQVKAWGRDIEPKKVTVPAHSMKMNLPERSFLRSALAEMDDQIKREIKSGITEAVK